MRILAIESSCDETAAAIVENGTKILSSVVASSAAMHRTYGGIVPEVASREQLKVVIPVIEETLAEAHLDIQSIDAIAVTVGPGLIGSLLIGVETAKTMALVSKKPLIPVNHVIAHMYANFLEFSPKNSPRAPLTSRGNHIEFPALSLVVSGGHTELFLMESMSKLTWLGGTLDDAAGEAFDKTARLLGFANGGGLAIEKVASQFNEHNNTTKQRYNIKFPRPMIYDETLNFSFSGLKTAVMRTWQKYTNSLVIPVKAGIHQWDTIPGHGSRVKPRMTIAQDVVNAFAFEIQEAITDVLVAKTIKAAQLYQAKSILISGGVASNLRLREKFNLNLPAGEAGRFKLNIFFPPIALCTDNAVSIAAYAFFKGKPVDWHTITALPDLSVEDNI